MKDKKSYKRYFTAGLLALLILPGIAGAQILNDPANPYQFQAGLETGFVGFISHRIQLGLTGTEFDYVEEGGQKNLFFFNRLTAEFKFVDRHNLIFLYQPLNLVTEDILENDLITDSLLFPAGTPMEFRYGFDFYRASYLYDFAKDPDRELSAGISFQIRNATISYAPKTGDSLRLTQNIGPVPILKFRWKEPFDNGTWFGFEADGFWADGRYITGSANDFMGAIFDVSARYGFKLREGMDSYINLRYLGGGARGQDETVDSYGDGYTDNWLNTVSLSLGFYLK
ncbi:hypothetical protein GF359_10380 [candidate division WOR-3 bacterium]|uniref:Outer membrane protein beta-barrel domain-containing protein n=1 Tax=candidate division WOR-3 bacterium TaxID=2052148 RepID=A0A9D5QE04_UNCW3|nr:hypothetical protein [candidate division WOR-3 bacterium]MBD3365607.1 hypothetical protein [candidate division WOR-3 bacterium]